VYGGERQKERGPRPPCGGLGGGQSSVLKDNTQQFSGLNSEGGGADNKAVNPRTGGKRVQQESKTKKGTI